MRIAVANKFWYRRGGLETIMFDEIEWLESAGHTVAHFATAHPDNEASAWSRFFSPYLELGQHSGLGISDKARAAVRLFHNREAARCFDALLDEFEPDLVHIHGVHRQISPSILGVARRRRVAVVQSLHDFHHICPADIMLRGTEAPCVPRRCGNYWYGPAVMHKCVRLSVTASLLSAAETTFARLSSSYESGVRRFTSPSRFLADEMRRAGWKAPIDVVPNAVALQPERTDVGSGFAVIGRLRQEKGVEVALKAARKLGEVITVAGDGPMRSDLEQRFPEARFVGHLPAEAVSRLVAGSRAILVPSTGLENASMSILETMSAGVPVIASEIGGIPEQITHGQDGLLFKPGDVSGLAAAMDSLARSPERARMLGTRARKTIAARFSPTVHMDGLLGSFGKAIDSVHRVP